MMVVSPRTAAAIGGVLEPFGSLACWPGVISLQRRWTICICPRYAATAIEDILNSPRLMCRSPLRSRVTAQLRANYLASQQNGADFHNMDGHNLHQRPIRYEALYLARGDCRCRCKNTRLPKGSRRIASVANSVS